MASELWLFAGPNGAGKSSFVNPQNDLLALFGAPPPKMLNADVYTRQLLRARGLDFHDAPAPLLKEAFLQCAIRVEEEAYAAVRAGQRTSLETVLSTPKYLPLVQEILAHGGRFHLIYVALNSPALSAARVAQRVREGGHHVPADRLEPRWYRSLANLPRFAALASTFHVFDNSTPGANAVLIAHGSHNPQRGQVCKILKPDAIPEVTEKLQTLLL